MTVTAKRERRGAGIKMPPSRLGRLLIALRRSVGLRQLDPKADPKFLAKARTAKHFGLSRKEAMQWVMQITGVSIEEDTIRRIEVGRQMIPLNTLKPLLIAYGLPPEDITTVLEDPNLNAFGGENPHLLAQWRMRNLALGEFGPSVHDALPVGKFVSTWVEAEKAGIGGFLPEEIRMIVTDSELEKPADFVKLADDAFAQNEIRKKKGIKGWSDNATLCLSSVTDDLTDDVDERRQITLHLRPSKYRYNVVAKQEAGAPFRWQALQETRHPIQPVPYLASGIGICINVICDEQKSIVIGQRSNDETFRKGEFDIAVVEGIRPSGDMIEGQIDIRSVAYRALSEELGLDRAVKGKGIADLIKRLVIFEFGCDLEFYQWNFLAFVEVDTDFDTLYRSWQKAKDRKENQTLRRIDFTESEVLKFVLERPIWSAGIACALRTFDYWDE